MDVKEKIFTREELYEKIWTTPIQRLAKEFGLSDVGLAKICRRHNIPRPPRGYWQKVEAGLKVSRIRLSKNKEIGESKIIIRPQVTESENPQEPKEDFSYLFNEVRPLLEAESHEENRIVVPDDLEPGFMLVKHTRRALKQAKPDKYNRVHPDNAGLDIKIHPSSIERVCRLVEALFRALKARGYGFEIVTPKPEPYRTYLQPKSESSMAIHGERITFCIEEKMKQKRHELTQEELKKKERTGYVYAPAYDFNPKDLIIFRMTNVPYRFRQLVTTEFVGTSRSKLEDRLNEIIVNAIKIAVLMKEDRRLREIEKRRAEENRRRQLELDRQQAIADARRKQLYDQVAEWEKAESIRRYVEAVEAHWSQTQSPISEESEIGQWIAWARRQADRLDPLLKGHPWTESVKIDEWRYRL